IFNFYKIKYLYPKKGLSITPILFNYKTLLIMDQYPSGHPYTVAVDCIIFGFDGERLKLLLIKRGFEPEKGKWSLMGGFVKPKESLDHAAKRVLHRLTGLEGVYLEQLKAFGMPKRDPRERTISVSYFALIGIHKYHKQVS